MNWSHKQEIERRIGENRFLNPIFSSVHDIPQRLYEYDRSFFVVYNAKKDKFELHNLENEGNTYEMTLPFEELDVRTLYQLWENDIRVHGTAIFDEIDRSQEKFEQDKAKQEKQHIQDLAKETQSMFAKDAWS